MQLLHCVAVIMHTQQYHHGLANGLQKTTKLHKLALNNVFIIAVPSCKSRHLLVCNLPAATDILILSVAGQGLCIFAAGNVLQLWSHSILANLRHSEPKPATEKDFYQVPQGKQTDCFMPGPTRQSGPTLHCMYHIVLYQLLCCSRTSKNVALNYSKHTNLSAAQQTDLACRWPLPLGVLPSLPS